MERHTRRLTSAAPWQEGPPSGQLAQPPPVPFGPIQEEALVAKVMAEVLAEVRSGWKHGSGVLCWLHGVCGSWLWQRRLQEVFWVYL